MTEVKSTDSALVTVSRAELADAVAFAARVLPKRPVVPVLAGMRVQVSAGRLAFAAFDYEVSARAAAVAETAGTADVLVTGPELVAAVKALPKGKSVTADLEVNGDGVVITCAGVRLTVASMGEEAEKEYPQLPVMPEAAGVADAAVFARSVARVAACAGTDDTLPVLTTVQVDMGAGLLTMAATDRYRLAADEMPWTCYGAGGTVVQVPAVHLAAYAKACAKDGKVYIGAAEHDGYARIGLTDGVREMTIALREGAFPKWRGLVRGDNDATVVTADAGRLATAVARAGKLCGRNDRLGFDVTGSGIVLTATRDGQAVSSETVPAQVGGPALETGFNAGYLASVLAGITGTARIGLVNAVKPVMVRAADGFTAVVVPIRRADS